MATVGFKLCQQGCSPDVGHRRWVIRRQSGELRRTHVAKQVGASDETPSPHGGDTHLRALQPPQPHDLPTLVTEGAAHQTSALKLLSVIQIRRPILVSGQAWLPDQLVQ